MEEREKKDKNQELAWELRVKVTVIPIIISALSTVNKGLIKGLEVLEIRGRLKNIQMNALLRLARILRKVLET